MISVLGCLFCTTAKDDNNCLDQMLMMIFTKNLQAFISEIFASSSFVQNFQCECHMHSTNGIHGIGWDLRLKEI